jgi:hypothetical protein
MKNFGWPYKIYRLCLKIDQLIRHYIIGERYLNKGEDGMTLIRKNYFNK